MIFPTDPTLDQLYTLGDKTWKWNGIGWTLVNTTDTEYAPLAHVGAGGDAHPDASTSVSGFMSAEDKTKLNNAVVGPIIAEEGRLAVYDDSTGKLLRQSPHGIGSYALKTDIPSEDPQYISGFGYTTTNNSVTIKPGRAYVESVGRIVSYPGGVITQAIPNATTIHFYMTHDGIAQASVLPPGAPYYGTARSRNDSTSRRYLFSIRSKPSGNQLYLVRGVPMGNVVDVTFLHNTNSESILSSNGTQSTATDISAENYAYGPVTTDLHLRLYNIGSSGSIRIYCYTGSGFSIWTNVPVAFELTTASVPCDETPKIQYDVTSGGISSVSLLGYRFER